jgi:sugar phosphate isomerase/epimerase
VNPDRLSLNQITVRPWSLEEVVKGCARHGIGSLAVWRDKLAEVGVTRGATMIRDAGLRVSSLCRGGMFTDPAVSAPTALDDNKRAVDEAAALGADVLVLVCGPLQDTDLPAARRRVADGVAALMPYAESAGVMVGIEPLHPMMISERSVVVSLRQANDLVETVGSANLGVVVDAYHVWWDPDLEREIHRATGRVLGYHVSDWLAETTDLLYCRGLMGDGLIDLPGLSAAVEKAGYRGPVEVEILSHELWRRDGDRVLDDVTDRFTRYV